MATNLKNKLDTVFSQYIRLRDMEEGRVFRCISCNRILPISQADCGHYINRQHMSTRWHEMNCHAQCRKCNRFDEGNMQGYRLGLVRMYGEKHVAVLESYKYRVTKYSDFEMSALIKYYKSRIKELLNYKKESSITCLTR